MHPLLYLAAAILAEVFATSALRASQGFARPLPTALCIAGYTVAFYALSRSLQAGLNMGVAYAIWSGVGILLIAVIGIVLFKERVDLGAVIGFALIVAGVVVLNLFSRTVRH